MARIIDWFLLCLLIGVVINAQIDGKFIKKEVRVVELCQGQVTSSEGLKVTEQGGIIWLMNWTEKNSSNANSQNSGGSTG